MAANSSQPNGSSILPSVIVGLGTIVVFALLVLLVSKLSDGGKVEVVANTGDQPPSAAELREQEAETLSTYGWVDQDKGTVRIPVERAAELLIEELNQ